jgi:hypothetical protein
MDAAGFRPCCDNTGDGLRVIVVSVAKLLLDGWSVQQLQMLGQGWFDKLRTYRQQLGRDAVWWC